MNPVFIGLTLVSPLTNSIRYEQVLNEILQYVSDQKQYLVVE